MKAEVVTVTVFGKREQLPVHLAAEKMVERYGEAVYSQQVTATRSAFFSFWREVDEALVLRIGEEELRRRVVEIVEEGAIPAEDLLDILSAHGALEGCSA